MSRIIKVWVTDSEYERISREHTNLQEDIRKFLGCTESPLVFDEEYIIQKIQELPEGFIFSYRDILDCAYDPEYPGMAGICARKIRTLCKERKLAECYGYDSKLKLRLYKKI